MHLDHEIESVLLLKQQKRIEAFLYLIYTLT